MGQSFGHAGQPRTPLRLLPELLRNALASLALALGFAALARRPGKPRTLLQEFQGTLRRSRFGGSGRRHPGSWGLLRELGPRDDWQQVADRFLPQTERPDQGNGAPARSSLRRDPVPLAHPAGHAREISLAAVLAWPGEPVMFQPPRQGRLN